ncbi:MAG TPA: winged helix-turn-helix domain-containing protein [Streptosporangiaceae bacterium]|nr:winged helix-turn-helix domain-containing protein [Streptosporangiaceae bacterium]
MELELTGNELLARLTAMANPHRLRIIVELRRGRVHVSELARRLEMSRPLLYMHLDKLEKAGFIVGQLELSEDGKAMKYYELAPFDLRLTADEIAAALETGGDLAAGARISPTDDSEER